MSMSIAQKSPDRNDELELSVVVPVFNESENVTQLVEEIAQALFATSYEMIFVDDCSMDNTVNVLTELKSVHPTLRVLTHKANAGQSRSVRTGVFAARGNLIATLDGDGQNNPADIPKLWEQIRRPGAPDNLAMVGGKRLKRQDSQAKLLASRLGNGVRKKLLKDQAEDTGCGIKVFRREAFLRLPYFDHIHRYLPALMLREGYAIEFADVSHRPRIAGKSKYTNFGRLKVSVADLRGVMWLMSRSRNPKGWDEV